MRRALASLLLALFSFPLIAPAFPANAPSQLPACCRRDGAHHCMMSGDRGTPGPAFQAIRPKCPFYSSTMAFPTEGKTAILGHSHAIFASVIRYPAALPRTESRYCAAFSPSHQKRGPPTQLS
jgi:hypothetical protein